MVLNGSLCMAADDKDLFNPACTDFLYNVLDGRNINNGKHFLGHRFCSWQETGSETSSRNYGFTHFCMSVPPKQRGPPHQ